MPTIPFRRVLVTVIALVAAHATASGQAPVPVDPLLECIGRNGVRYIAPGNATDAQYADIAALCQRALEAGEVTGGFTPDGSDPGSGSGAARPSRDAAPQARGPGEGADGQPAGGDAARTPDASQSDEVRRRVSASIAQDADARSPLPSDASFGSVRVLGPLAVIAALIAVSAVVGVAGRRK